MLPLPVDAHLEAAHAALAKRGTLVLVSPPGSGKSTRLPPALIGEAGTVLLLQPRRVAARSLARRIAEERGWELGGQVGFQVRFEKVGGKATRLWVMTEGTLTRRLQDDPYLEGVSTVILDEFHERSLHTDLCLAWCAELRRTVRDDLRVVVMSATMDPAPVSRFLGDAPVLSVGTPAFPVTTRLEAPRPEARIEDSVVAAVGKALDDPEGGDVLVFLPGTGEIRACEQALSGRIEAVVLPLHGSLPPEAQDAALRPDPSGRRRVILATNVAETSVTIPGVRTVIDSGLARVARFDADSGLDQLVLERISRANADQRAGRAGRTAPGRCVRLWSPLEDRRLPAAADPEIARVDLAPTLLLLKGWHGADPRAFPWFAAPGAERLAHGEALLARLGASEAPFAALTALGRRLAGLPVHPRLGRLLLAAVDAGVPRLGAALAALVGERDLRPPPRRDARPPDPDTADAHDRLACLTRAESSRFHPRLRDEGIDPIAAREAARVRDDLLRLIAGRDAGLDAAGGQDHVPRLLLAAYPDRVAKRTAATANTCAMVGGIGVEIDRHSCCAVVAGQRRGELVLAHRIQEIGDVVRRRTIVRQAAELTEDDLEAVFPGSVRRRDQVVFDAARGRVDGLAGWWYQDLCLRLATGAQIDSALMSACLAEALRPGARALFLADEPCASLLTRVAWLRHHAPDLDLPELDDAVLARIVTSLCDGRRTRAEVDSADKLSWLQMEIGHERIRSVEILAPDRLEVPSGSRLRLIYEDASRAPTLAVRIQEVFGLVATPRICGERVPVLLHLLGPNYRPEQVTQDLASFWANTYPKVRKDLRIRYPKHSWPENPLTAQAVRKGPSERR